MAARKKAAKKASKKASKKAAKKASKRAAKRLSAEAKCKKVTINSVPRTLCWDRVPVPSHKGYAIVSNTSR
jgi:hypothetical protein